MLLAALATFAAAALQSASGFGFALIAGPALFALLEPEEAVATVLAMGIAINALMLVGERRPREIRGGDLVVPLAAAVPGLVLGTLLLRALDKEVLQVAVGLSVIAATVLQARPRPQPVRRPDATGAGLGDAAMGLTVGVLTTSTSVNGPPLLLWLLARGASPVEVRDTLAVAFMALNAAGMAAVILAAGTLSVLDAEVLALVPLIGAGWLAGRYVFGRLGAERFRALNLALAAAAGLASLIAGLV